LAITLIRGETLSGKPVNRGQLLIGLLVGGAIAKGLGVLLFKQEIVLWTRKGEKTLAASAPKQLMRGATDPDLIAKGITRKKGRFGGEEITPIDPTKVITKSAISEAKKRTLRRRLQLLWGLRRTFKISALDKNTIQLVRDLTIVFKREVAIIQVEGNLFIRIGKPTKVGVGGLGKNPKLILHTHPSGYLALSPDDIDLLNLLKQGETLILGPGGQLVRYTRNHPTQWDLETILFQMIRKDK